MRYPAPLPRAFCAGLIEASRGRSFRFLRRSCYPVLFARASLKHLAVRHRDSGLAGYPVLFARASLKRGVERERVSLRRRLPRAFCAGLIEARIALGNSPSRTIVTPCFLRGPH